jgi:hypothetical protein
MMLCNRRSLGNFERWELHLSLCDLRDEEIVNEIEDHARKETPPRLLPNDMNRETSEPDPICQQTPNPNPNPT